MQHGVILLFLVSMTTVARAAQTNVITMKTEQKIEEILEDENLLFAHKRNQSFRPRTYMNIHDNWGVHTPDTWHVTPAPPRSLTPHPLHVLQELEEEDFLLPSFGESLSRDKRDAGSGQETVPVTAYVTLEELYSEALLTQTTRVAAVGKALTSRLEGDDVDVDTLVVDPTITNDNDKAKYTFVITFGGFTDRDGVAFSLETAWRQEVEIAGFEIFQSPQIENSAGAIVNVVCCLCPVDRPCVDGVCGASETAASTRQFVAGQEEADAIMPRSVDNTAECFMPSGLDGVPYGNDVVDRISIGDNGIVCFGESFNPYDQEGIPENKNCICVYCNDWDYRSTNSEIRYQTYRAGRPWSNSIIDRAGAEVRNCFQQYSRFRASLVIVVTWRSIPEFRSFSSRVDTGNTFQAVIITDGRMSFVQFFYVDIRASTMFRANGVHGFRNRNTMEEMLYSRRRGQRPNFNKPPMHTVPGNCDVNGKWIFQIGDITVPNYRTQCIDWYLSNIRRASFYRQRSNSLGSFRCPCRRPVLTWMAIFQPLPPFTSAAVFCQRAGFWRDTYECCYDVFGLFINRYPDSGGYLTANPRFSAERYKRENSDPKDWCCRRSNLCHLYEQVRPRSSCRFRRPIFRFRFFFGDPHFFSLDGKPFTFNGIGEYRLIEVTKDGVTFKLQCRTAQAVSSTGAKVQASLFTAFAAAQTSTTYGDGSVHVELSNDKTKFAIFINDVDKTLEYYNTADFLYADTVMTVNKVNDTRVEISFVKIEVMVTVQIVSGTLSQATILPDDFNELPVGLLGNFNGNDADDFRYPNGADVLSASSTDQQLFPWGKSWAVQASDSVLHYGLGETTASLTDNSFSPLFSSQISVADREAAASVCGGTSNEQCIYDYVLTGNADLALAAKTQMNEADTANTELENRSPEITGTSKIDAKVGTPSSLMVSATDADSDTVKFNFVEQPPGFVFDAATGTGTFQPTDTNPVQIQVNAEDDKGAQSPILEVQVRLCGECNNGVCDYSRPMEPINSTAESMFYLTACTCNKGYTGAVCTEDIDGCADNPCGTGQQCTDTPAAQHNTGTVPYTCVGCPSGYKLESGHCENVDECRDMSDMCPANSDCVDNIGSYLCTCMEGYRMSSSNTCVDIDECVEHTNNCEQKCINTPGSHTCACYDGFTLEADGANCTRPDEPAACATKGCNQLCVLDGTNPVCKCKEGYELDTTGLICEDINECERHICAQGCTNNDGSYTCFCRPGFKLAQDKLDCDRCEFPYYGNNCESTCECRGRATSCDAVHGCVCVTGWTGTSCEVDVNECETDPNICGTNKYCTNTNGSYTCLCPDGYVTNGDSCDDVDECSADTSICPDDSTCVNLVGSYVCNCNLGFKKVNGQCVDIDECAVGMTACQQKCTNKPGSYNCYCYSGFILNDDRKTCSQDTTNPCEGLTNIVCGHYCTVEGGQPVCKCNVGFELAADGKTCQDINECESAAINMCSNKDTCVNSLGSYTCACPAGTTLQNDGRSCVACDDNHWGVGCANTCGCSPLGTDTCDKVTGCTCKAGFTGDKCQDDVDECSSQACQTNADCINSPGAFSCQCRTGYTEVTVSGTKTCADVDECASAELNTCDQGCENIVGSYHCTCTAGFMRSGTGTCIDVDECTAGTHDCSQVCRNTVGSFTCECHPGFELDAVGRKTCTPIAGATTCTRTVCTGSCRIENGQEICFCDNGYTLSGDFFTCEDINECTSANPCNGTCTNTPAGSFTCSCDPGYKLGADRTSCEVCPPTTWGTNCVNTCSCNTANTVSCNSVDGTCTCRDGWSGDRCSDDVKECTINATRCGPNGFCTELNGTFSCSCVVGYIRSNGVCSQCSSTKWGTACSEDCQCNFANTQTCDHVRGGCTCKPEWTGTTCNDDFQECADTTTPRCTGPQEVCVELQGSHECGCANGYERSADNTRCDDTNECLSSTANTCTYQCNNTPGGFECTCSPGYLGSGNNCTANFGQYLVEVTLDQNSDNIIADRSSPAYSKLQQDIGRGIDAATQTVMGVAQLSAEVQVLRIGSVIAPVNIRVDEAQTDNPTGVFAAALEKLSELGVLNVDGTTTNILNVTYNTTSILKMHDVCDVLRIVSDFDNDEICTVNNGIPAKEKLQEPGLNVPLIAGLSVAILIILLLLLACILYVCCCRKRKSASDQTPSEERDNVAFRSAFVGNLPTKGNFGASRYMMYSPHTLSDAGSLISDNSSGRHPRRSKKPGSHDFYDLPQWMDDRIHRAPEPQATSRPSEPTSNFSWEHLFDRLDPLRNGNFEVPRPAVNSSPARPFRDSNA